jgi:hypothetical protein
MNPVRTLVEWHIEGLGVGDAAATDMIGGFNHDKSHFRRYQAPRRSDSSGASADNDHIDIAGRRTRADGRRGDRGSASGQHCAARNRLHGIRNIDATGDIA